VTHGADLRDRVAIVTGAGGGIGRATCAALADRGARLTVVDADEARAAALADEVRARGVEVLPLCLDVRVEADMEEMAARTLERFGRVDVLVACAGVLRGSGPRTVAEMSVGEWDLVVETNLKGVFLSNRAVVSAMVAQRRGVIVNLSSTSGRRGLAYDSAYCASKFGVIGFSEALAEEVRPFGVKVQVVLPGPVETPFWEQNAPLPAPPEMLPAERVADLILYLVDLPDDTVLVHPTIVGFRARHRSAPPGGRRQPGNG
jgi:NAD(P)-dependent dehydrogenase (short-subunit alcohol dehydrogenase family)